MGLSCVVPWPVNGDNFGLSVKETGISKDNTSIRCYFKPKSVLKSVRISLSLRAKIKVRWGLTVLYPIKKYCAFDVPTTYPIRTYLHPFWHPRTEGYSNAA